MSTFQKKIKGERCNLQKGRSQERYFWVRQRKRNPFARREGRWKYA